MPPALPASGADSAAQDRRHRLVGIAWLVGATICFACIDASAKWLNRSMPPLQTVTIRYLGAFVVIALLLNPRTKPGVLRTQRPLLQVARGLGLVVSSICLITALNYLSLTATTAINFASPLIVALLAGPMLGETLGPRRLGAVVVGFVGVLVVTHPWTGTFHPAMGLAFLCACSTALYAIITRVLARHDSPETTMFYTAVVGAVAVLPFIPFVWHPLTAPRVWTAIAAISFFGAAGHWMMILAYRKAPASVVAPFFYAQLLWAVGIAAVIFQEVPAPATLLGGGIVIASGLYLLHRERVRKQPPSTDATV
ncbi:MAG: DMT family transporter [Verrucomicrobiota bacterium]